MAKRVRRRRGKRVVAEKKPTPSLRAERIARKKEKELAIQMRRQFTSRMRAKEEAARRYTPPFDQEDSIQTLLDEYTIAERRSR